ncbi:hypothetical protein [Pseudolysinimonas kribbensis]|nr:hypothetical protein [Pseudolysinimonas kribbensis]
MSSIRNPVGPQPPQVYWRRRLLLLLGVVAVLVVIVLIVVRPGGGSPSSAETKSPGPHATSPNPNPTFSTDGPAGSCDPSVITLTPVTDAASYASTTQPKLSMSITNSGAKACTLDVGTKAQVYTITSGAETIWTSTDCQTDAVSDVRTLQPGKSLTTTPFAWDRTRSSKSTCSATNKTPVIAGGASYHLQVKVGSVTSSASKQFVLQ